MSPKKVGLVFKALLRVSSLKHILRTEINRPGEKQTLLALAEDRQDMNIVGKIINKYY